jgi:hypothetical protein
MACLFLLRRVRLVSLIVFLGAAATVEAGGQPEHLQGRPLTDALRVLQRRGLPIVFSSEIVTPDMRVVAEPRAPTPREQLDEVLRPHGLRAQSGPGHVIQIVRAAARVSQRDGTWGPDSKRPVPPDDTADAGPYTTRVTVTGEAGAAGVVSRTGLDPERMRATGASLSADILQDVHALPGVAAVGDYRGEFSVRGSRPDQIGMVVDGVAVPWLLHEVRGRADIGSLSMLAGDRVESATLEAGAYPQRYEDRLGAELSVQLREGSRESRHVGGSVDSNSATALMEGPLGSARQGSWIASVRNSYREWPLTGAPAGSAFAFADAHGKIVYDLNPTQQLSVLALGGDSQLDAADNPLPSALTRGTSATALVTIGWRSLLHRGTALHQRLSYVGQSFTDRVESEQDAARAVHRQLSLSSDLFQAIAGGTLRGGLEVVRQSTARRVPTDVSASVPAGSLNAVWHTGAAYAHFDRTIAGHLNLGGGLRVSRSTAVEHQAALSRWMLARWRIRSGWTVSASAGVSHQFPATGAVISADPQMLEPERALHTDVGVERVLTPSLRLRVGAFSRSERDVLWPVDDWAAWMNGMAADTGAADRRLDGTSRGAEIVLTDAGAGRLSGWVSYSYGQVFQKDTATGHRFWSPLDQRHTMNAVAVYAGPARTSLRVVLRAATGTPLFADASPVRRPTYARLDVRGQKILVARAGRLTFFAEVLNVLNRDNRLPTTGTFGSTVGETIGLTTPTMPRRAAGGIAFVF